jgi:uncharacterized membrane protein YccF (DUF307 family)
VRLLLNLLWIVFGGGFVLWLEYMLGGILLCLTIVGIPFGVQCFKIAGLALLPFGKDIDLTDTGGTGVLRFVFNLLWFVVAGLWIFLTHAALAIALAITIIGIPFAWAHLKLAGIALWPIGKMIVPVDDLRRT